MSTATHTHSDGANHESASEQSEQAWVYLLENAHVFVFQGSSPRFSILKKRETGDLDTANIDIGTQHSLSQIAIHKARISIEDTPIRGGSDV